MWVHRVDGAIQSAYPVRQPDYADEELADDDAELLAFLNHDVNTARLQRENAVKTAERQRAETLAAVERQMASGAPQEEINKSIIQLLKGE